MDDDEQELVVSGGIGLEPLQLQELGDLQIAAVGEPAILFAEPRRTARMRGLAGRGIGFLSEGYPSPLDGFLPDGLSSRSASAAAAARRVPSLAASSSTRTGSGDDT